MQIFVLCPAAHVTGGPEALHQFAHKAMTLGFDARMVYYPSTDGPAPKAYAHYGVRCDQHILDTPDSLVVAPEVLPEMLVRLRHAQRALWWLSVDNAERADQAHPTELDGGLSPLAQACAPSSNVIHLAQSEYARRHLGARGISARTVTDYLPTAFMQAASQLRGSRKFDVVLYNPRKGIEFTRRLIEASRGRLDWVPIEGLSPAEVAELLAYSKIYVDFGDHPGRDRIPREAAIAGCCVITGSRGAAGNGVDVPIPAEFVFDESDAGVVDRVVETIEAAIGRFGAVTEMFGPYREWIRNQEQAFTDEVGELLGYVRPLLLRSTLLPTARRRPHRSSTKRVARR